MFHHAQYGEMSGPVVGNSTEPVVPVFVKPRKRRRTEWSEEELRWLLQWAKLWRELNPELVQYSWRHCLRAIRDDPTADVLFREEHKTTEALREAYRRAYTAANSDSDNEEGV